MIEGSSEMIRNNQYIYFEKECDYCKKMNKFNLVAIYSFTIMGGQILWSLAEHYHNQVKCKYCSTIIPLCIKDLHANVIDPFTEEELTIDHFQVDVLEDLIKRIWNISEEDKTKEDIIKEEYRELLDAMRLNK